MRANVRKMMAVSAVTLAILSGSHAVAFAETTDPTPAGGGELQPGPPPEEGENGFTPASEQEAELPTTTGKPSEMPAAEHCAAKNVYKPTANLGRKHEGIGIAQSNYNDASRTLRSWFKAEVGGEVKLTHSGELKASAGVVVAELEAKYSVDLSVSVTAKMGNEIQIDTPPKKTTYAKYGVWRLKNTGTSYTIYSNCRTSAKSTVTTLTPWYVGWYVWER
ncbi:hypothetical protein ACFV2S_32815 [Streptomyces sp. NPDC059695]|uniref:hypothetical protein n=1 Tax=Streptomyces sp. NPDC059695 TaxID=3346910 RepID=UPI0036C7E068